MEVHVAMLCTATKHNTTACVCTVNKAPTAIPVSTDLWQFFNIFLIILHVNNQNLGCLKKISLLECVKGRGTDFFLMFLMGSSKEVFCLVYFVIYTSGWFE